MLKRLLSSTALAFVLGGGPATAQDLMNLESPKQDKTYTGVGYIMGWAVMEGGLKQVEWWLDDKYKGLIPCCFARKDVEELYGQLETGYGKPIPYMGFAQGEHEIRVKATGNAGTTLERTVVFYVDGIKDYIRDNEMFLKDAEIAFTENGIEIKNAIAKGISYDLVLKWQQDSQQFVVVSAYSNDENIVRTDTYKKQVLRRINEYREGGYVCGTDYEGTDPEEWPEPQPVRPLKWDVSLANAAMKHSADMAKNNYTSHTGLDGSTPSSRAIDAGYTGVPGEEVIVMDFYDPVDFIDYLIEEETTCAVLLNPRLRHIGNGVVTARKVDHQSYWTLMLGYGELK